MSPLPEIESFERAFVATAYLLGRREALTAGLATVGDAAARVAAALVALDRKGRAERLAAELRPIAVALDARRLR